MLAFQTPHDAPRWKRWCVYSPLARILWFAVFLAALSFASTLVLKAAGFHPKEVSPAVRSLVRWAVQVGCTIAAYAVVVRWIERRRMAELSWRAAVAQTSAGTAAGAVLISAVIALMALAGGYRITATNPGADWLVPLLTVGFGAAISEEIIFRGVLLRISEEGLGTTWALVLSSAFFGGVHLFNDGATFWSAAAIAVEAGLLLGLLYHVTRSLWPCIGLHAGWNYFQGTVWGVPVSGTSATGLLQSSRSGPDWLTGGVWGPEGSAIAVVLNVGVAVALLLWALRRNTWVAARWPRARVMEAAPAAGGAPC